MFENFCRSQEYHTNLYAGDVVQVSHVRSLIGMGITRMDRETYLEADSLEQQACGRG